MAVIPDLYPLTGLQIGDIQSYVSQAFLYFAPASNRLLILVDNRPWMLNKHSRSAKLWQLVVTKYRMSPFTNNKKVQKASLTRSKSNRSGSFKSNHNTAKWSQRWLPVIDSAKWQEKYILSVMDLSKALHGFIIFEVAWKDVHGINYLNELQIDASLALEVKYMRKWEFYSPKQALSSISLWFSRRPLETQSLEMNIRLLFELDDDFLDVLESPSALKNEMSCRSISFDHDSLCREMDEEAPTSPTQYTDELILFRFNDCVLPVKLQEVIMSDLRLLTLLEAGLPSWVIFFQSYPLFCHLYRPWMRHLARTLYIFISLITVIIGFYDLYKNVPLLKATAARLCGPLFGWIEEWDMLSRIRYLGTMLFLHNFEKGLKWFLILVQMTRTFISGVAKPLIKPLSEIFNFFSPLWNEFAELGEKIYSTVWFVLQLMLSTFLDFIECFLQPFEVLFSYLCCIVKLAQQFLCIVRDLLFVPIQCTLAAENYIRSLISGISFQEVWESCRHLFKLASVSKPKRASYDISMWKALWNDLFSHIFRAIRSIINGLMAFFITCNRHRLSTYNHMRDYLERLSHLAGMESPQQCRRRPQASLIELPEEGDSIKCIRCK